MNITLPFFNTVSPLDSPRLNGMKYISLNAALFLHYGEHYFTLKYADEEIKVPLSDIDYD